MMNNAILQNFIQLISANTGLNIREQDQKELCNKIYVRIKSLKLDTPEQYYQLLLTTSQDSYSSNNLNEWKQLLLLLTIGETYFFRDQGHCKLLKNQILPKIITNKRTSELAINKKPCLRIWSAGCSSGEEAYSLAILVKELIPDLSEWNVLILGTDINLEVIEKAKQGIYDAWSFRQVEQRLKQQYFHLSQGRWKVDEQIRNMVKFRYGNLFQEDFPNPTSDIHSMDIIICRNVFIYFNPQAIATVVEKFYRTLSPAGYLIAGHTELHGQNIGQLQPRVFPESIVYQRSQNLQTEPRPLIEFPASLRLKQNISVPSQAKTKSTSLIPTQTQGQTTKTNLIETSQTDFSQAETYFHAGEYTKAIQAAKQIIQHQPKHFDAYYLIAQAWANLGDYEQATKHCQQAIQINNFSEKPYYLLAHIAEEKGDIEQAKTLFKKIIYLAPSSIGAYLEISSIYAKEGDQTRAKKMLATAFDLLKKLSPNLIIESYHQNTAGELLNQVKKMLDC